MSHEKEPFFFDHTILSTFRSCNENARLAYVKHLALKGKAAPALTFGGAFHKAIETFYKSKKTDYNEKIHDCKLAFIGYVKQYGMLPIGIENSEGEKRSVERGLSLIDAYFYKWRNESFVNVLRPDTGEPYVEIGFKLWLMEWAGHPVFIVGTIDKLMRNRADGRIYIFETKTTSQGLTNFITHVRPNHQVTTYNLAAKRWISEDIAGTIWDCIFISSRQPDPKSKDPWLRQGIDINKDFARTETRRSSVDLEEVLFDLQESARYYLSLLHSPDVTRWPRNAPAACHMYGGCDFRKICESNLNESIIRNYYEERRWEPWLAMDTK